MGTMLRSLQILFIGIAMLAPLAFGQLGSLSDYDGVLQAKFALKISESDPEAAEPEAMTLTSAALIREYDLPATARVFWVLDFSEALIQGGLVLADGESGEIYSVIAEATQVDLQASLDGNEAAVDFGQDGVDDWMSANFVLHFDIDGLELSARAPMKFQYIESRKVSFLRMVSAGGLVGEGVLDDQTRLSVTGGNLSASGIIANLD